ncbi:MAG: hypothetical protein II272_09410 [Oscillospiraceae bacterium]|nr:hypothetical protein [Oscillospiraceae bacterium]
MIIDKHVYQSLLYTFLPVPPETGCILGSKNGVICEFEYDMGSQELMAAIYTPNVKRLNQVISDWRKRGIDFCGLAHSHPSLQRTHSANDISYIKTIMRSLPVSVDKLYFPLVFPNKDMVSFFALRGDTGIQILDDEIELY